MKIKTVSIIGLGALGVLFGRQLSQKMPEGTLRIVADPARIARYRADGVFCNGERCDFRYVSSEERGDPADLALFCVKYGALEDACRAMRGQIGPDTVILSALNGVTSEERIAAHFGEQGLLYCVAQGTDAVKVKNRLTYHNAGELCFGDRTPGPFSDKAKRVAEFFDSVQFPYELMPDMMHHMWGKLMLNVGVNQTVAVFEGDYGTIQRPGEARDTMIAAMRETLAVANREGVALTEDDLAYWLALLDTLSPEGKPSLRQDLEAGRNSEVELFSGTILRLGEKHGVKTPVNRMLYEKIRAIEQAF